jgi:hypothetical protein
MLNILPTADCVLATADCQLPTDHRLLRFAVRSRCYRCRRCTAEARVRDGNSSQMSDRGSLELRCRLPRTIAGSSDVFQWERRVMSIHLPPTHCIADVRGTPPALKLHPITPAASPLPGIARRS